MKTMIVPADSPPGGGSAGRSGALPRVPASRDPRAAPTWPGGHTPPAAMGLEPAATNRECSCAFTQLLLALTQADQSHMYISHFYRSKT